MKNYKIVLKWSFVHAIHFHGQIPFSFVIWLVCQTHSLPSSVNVKEYTVILWLKIYAKHYSEGKYNLKMYSGK